MAANLIVSKFGPNASVYTAFAFVGLDFTTMDRLHDDWNRRGLWWKMALLIGTGSALSWAFNWGAGQIGLASFIAFLISGVVDRVIYAALPSLDRRDRVFWSNIGSSLTDSALFLTLAFGWPPSIPIVFGQFTAKLAGGALWARFVRARNQ